MKVLQHIFTVLLLVSLLVSPLSFTACQTSTPPEFPLCDNGFSVKPQSIHSLNIPQTGASSLTEAAVALTDEGVITASIPSQENPQIILPSKLYATAGHEFVLYYDNILRCMVPDDYVVTTVFDGDSPLYKLNPLYDRMLRFTPDESHVGEHSLTVKVIDRRTWKTVATKSTTLIISTDRTFTDKNVLFIGDSFTFASSYAAEIMRMSEGGIQSVGTIRRSISFNGGVAVVYSEGRNSAASFDYVNDPTFAGYSNPFYNPNIEYSLPLDQDYKAMGYPANGNLTFDYSGSTSVLKHHFDFSYYMETNADTVEIPDAIFINLGTNGGNARALPLVYAAFDAMIESIRDYSTDIPIFIHLYPPLARGGNINRGSSIRNADVYKDSRLAYYDCIQTLIDRYDYDDRVILVPTYTMLDPIYDYKQETVSVSARNPETVTIGQTDGTHPALPGYLHMADSYYNVLQATWTDTPHVPRYSIKNQLTFVETTNLQTTVLYGQPYDAVLKAMDGYELKDTNIMVMMGSQTIPVVNGVIHIPSVTDHISITATASAVVPDVPPNLVDITTANRKEPDTTLFRNEFLYDYYITYSGCAVFKKEAGTVVTNLIPVKIGQKIIIEGLDISTASKINHTRLIFFNADGSMPCTFYYSPATKEAAGYVDQEAYKKGTLIIDTAKMSRQSTIVRSAYFRICGIPIDGAENIVIRVE